VVKTDGQPTNACNILLREIIGDMLLSSLSGGITTIVSLFTIPLMKNHKSVSDMIADTAVIKIDKLSKE
jgi:hypothetical protein